MGIAAGQSQQLDAKRDGAQESQLAGLPGHPGKDGEPQSHAPAAAASVAAAAVVARQQFRVRQQVRDHLWKPR